MCHHDRRILHQRGRLGEEATERASLAERSVRVWPRRGARVTVYDNGVADQAGSHDDALEANLGAIALRPARDDVGKVKDVIDIAESLDALAPGVGAVVKGLASVAAWAWNVRKVDRVRETLIGLYERLQRTRDEYVRKEEFQDLLEEALRRMSEQPDGGRRAAMRSIFEKILERPMDDHVENRRFLRLADELPAAALRILAVTNAPLNRDEIMLPANSILAKRANVPPAEIDDLMDYLATERLFDRRKFDMRPPNSGLAYLLSSTGRAYLDYATG